MLESLPFVVWSANQPASHFTPYFLPEWSPLAFLSLKLHNASISEKRGEKSASASKTPCVKEPDFSHLKMYMQNSI